MQLTFIQKYIYFNAFLIPFTYAWLGPQIPVIFLIWFGISFLSIKLVETEKSNQQKNKTTETNPTTDEQNLIKVISISYPIIELIIKAFIIYDIIPYSWTILNRIEHALFSFLATIIITSIISKKIKISPFVFTPLIAFLIVNFMGIGNEILEFIIRKYIISNEHITDIYKLYYADTIYDFITNAIASIIAVIIIIKYSLISDKEKILTKQGNTNGK